MINAILWIRDPYPFRQAEIDALQDALPTHTIYLKEWPVHYVAIDNTTITTCKLIAAILKTVHKQWAILDKVNGREYCKQLEIDIRGAGDGRPEWANTKVQSGAR